MKTPIVLCPAAELVAGDILASGGGTILKVEQLDGLEADRVMVTAEDGRGLSRVGTVKGTTRIGILSRKSP